MRRSFLPLLLVLALLFFACATANLLVAIRATNLNGKPTTPVANLFGAEAAAKGWPAAAPMPWPIVTQWSADRHTMVCRSRVRVSAVGRVVGADSRRDHAPDGD